MSTTLTNGLKLPDKGSVDWYADMQNNYTILDGAVGTIAEHTSQIAGKAPAVHTHTKADITDFPAYGTTAGTICEGNDSRLSDARTPLSHTHTKANITDLLNSNFIPSANNSYDLGSSSYQWNNLYAKNYYCNGVAWGLDKDNVWSSNNEFKAILALGNNGEIWFKNSKIDDLTTNPAEPVGKSVLQLWNKDTSQYSGGLIDYQMTDGSHIFEIACFGYPLNDSTSYQHRFRFVALRDGSADFYPTYSNVNLGTSTNKWKSLNGVNPGALSLPDYTLAKVDLIDFSQWSVAGQPNEYTPISDGWLFVNIKDTASNSIFIYAHSLYNSSDQTKSTDYSASCFGNGSQGIAGRIAVMLPVRAGIVYRIYIKAASVSEIFSAKFYPALGNV